MKAETLLAAYPDCPLAVAWTELMICQPSDEDPESSWELAMKLDPPLSPHELLDIIKQATVGETVGKAEQALAQMDHPSFLTYLKGKMGAV